MTASTPSRTPAPPLASSTAGPRLRVPKALPLLALAAAATPPLVYFPLMVVIGGKSLYLSDLLLPAAACLALLRRSRAPGLELVVWAYAFVIALQAAAGIAHGQPFNAFTQDLRGPVYLILGYLVAARLFTPSHVRSTLGTATAILWYTAVMMTVTIATGVELLAGRSEDVRAYQAGGGAVEVDAVRFIVNSKGLAFIVLVTAVAVLFSKSASRNHRLLAAALATPAFLITFLAYARATLLALLVCVLVGFAVRHRAAVDGRRLAATALVVMVSVGLVGLTGTAALVSDPEGNAVARQVAGFEERVLGGLGENAAESPGNVYRLLENEYAIRSWAENPLFGHGIGAEFKPATFGDASLQAFEENESFGVRFLHNGWLWYLVKTGLVGAIAFSLLLFVPVVRTLWGAVPRAVRPVDVGLALSVVGLAVINVFEPDLHRVGTAPVAGAVLGYLAVRSGAARVGRRTSQPSNTIGA